MTFTGSHNHIWLLALCLCLLRLPQQNNIDCLTLATEIYFCSGGWEVQDQDASTVWFQASWLADSCLLAVSTHNGERKRASSLMSLLLKTPIPFPGPHPHALF